MYGNLSAFKMLLGDGILTNEDLAKGNKKGDTALHEAAKLGQKEIMEVLLEYERDLVMVSNNSEETPLFTAASGGKKEVFDLLIKDGRIHSDHYVMARTDGSTVLHAAIMEEYFSLAMSMLETFPKLAHKYDNKGRTALDLLATKPLSFNRGSSCSLVNLGSRPFIPLQLIAIFVYFCIPSMVYGWKHVGDEENQHQNGHNISNLGHLATKLITGSDSEGFLEVEIDDAKQKHEFALALAKKLVNEESDWIHYSEGKCLDSTSKNSDKKTKLKNPIVHATKNGIIKLVKEILKIFPDAAYSFDKNGKNILHIAVEQKDGVLYDYLKKNVDHKDRMLSDVDNHGNTVLHLACHALKKYIKPNLLNMHCCVWYDSPPHFLYLENSNGMTAKELFEINHIELRDKAEKAFKDMNNGLMLVTALIGIVNYAALFTLPGGYDQDNQSKTYGEPILLIREDTEDDTSKFLWANFIGPPPISCSEAFKLASICNSSESSKGVCKFLMQEGVQPIDARCNTILHFLAMYGNLSAFQKLLRMVYLMHEELMKGNKKGDTALHERDLVMVSNNLGETPLFIAASCGKKDVFDLRIKDGRIHSDHSVMARTDGSTVLHAAIVGEHFSLAMSILETFPRLAHKYDGKGRTPLNLLTTKSLPFNSGSPYSLVNLGSRPFIPL
ncbi:unnamed protein product [Camellia sinensis]